MFLKKLILLFLILLLAALTACGTKPSMLTEEPVPVVTVTATLSGENIEEKVKGELVELDPIPFYTSKNEGEIYPSYMLAGLSSGQMYTDTFDKYILDVLDVYLLLDSKVVTLPLIVGFSDGTTYVNTVMGGNTRGDMTRAELLDHMAANYPQWQTLVVMDILIGDIVTDDSVSWDTCEDKYSMILQMKKAEYCEFAHAFADAHLAEMALLYTGSVESLEEIAQEDFALPWFLGKLIRQGE